MAIDSYRRCGTHVLIIITTLVTNQVIIYNGDNDATFDLSTTSCSNGNIQKNVFKRIQAPPIILTSKSSYGYDIRESILPVLKTKRFLLLQSKIEKLDIYQSNKKLIN